MTADETIALLKGMHDYIKASGAVLDSQLGDSLAKAAQETSASAVRAGCAPEAVDAEELLLNKAGLLKLAKSLADAVTELANGRRVADFLGTPVKSAAAEDERQSNRIWNEGFDSLR